MQPTLWEKKKREMNPIPIQSNSPSQDPDLVLLEGTQLKGTVVMFFTSCSVMKRTNATLVIVKVTLEYSRSNFLPLRQPFNSWVVFADSKKKKKFWLSGKLVINLYDGNVEIFKCSTVTWIKGWKEWLWLSGQLGSPCQNGSHSEGDYPQSSVKVYC